MGKNAFVDLGYQSGRDFSNFFFGSPDFSQATLRRLVDHDTRATKDALAFETARALAEGELRPDTVLQALADQPRQWLSLRFGEAVRFPPMTSASQLLTSYGQDGWYGPIQDNLGRSRLYIRSLSLPHFYRREKDIGEARIRWLVFAEFGNEYLAISWNNFTLSLPDKVDVQTQFPFWQHVPIFIQEIEELVGGSWSSLNFHRLVLHDLWNRFVGDSDYRWKHLRVRAELKGVALNAHSSGAADVDIRGLEALTKALAESAARAIRVPLSTAQKQTLENGILQTLIREWGTNSYEFSLEEMVDADSTVELFRAHCYFGLRHELSNQDSFQHMKCYIGSGGHKGAAEFILKQREPPS